MIGLLFVSDTNTVFLVIHRAIKTFFIGIYKKFIFDLFSSILLKYSFTILGKSSLTASTSSHHSLSPLFHSILILVLPF